MRIYPCCYHTQGEGKVERLQNISGPLIALEHVVRQEYFPKQLSEYFVAFLSR